MDWLLHNPLANLYGPYFLVFYALLTVGILAASFIYIRSQDTTAGLPRLKIPENVDPHEIAYFRGGANELLRVIIFSLLHRGYLALYVKKGMLGLTKKNFIAQNESPPDRNELPPLKQLVFDWFAEPREPAAILNGSLKQTLQPQCDVFEEHFKSQQLLMPTERDAAALTAGLIGGFLILAVGGYKVFAAIATGHKNVAFLIVMGTVSLFVLAKICRNRRLSSRGQRYLSDLQTAFEDTKTSMVSKLANSTASTTDAALMVAIFGVSALSATQFSYYSNMFSRSSGNSYANCGSCGGTSCSSGGSSCGGGGGGCGGGGCGGCGGGGD